MKNYHLALSVSASTESSKGTTMTTLKQSHDALLAALKEVDALRGPFMTEEDVKRCWSLVAGALAAEALNTLPELEVQAEKTCAWIIGGNDYYHGDQISTQCRKEFWLNRLHDHKFCAGCGNRIVLGE